MYNRDMPVLARHGFSSADGFADICTFVFCTIQQPLQSVGTQLADIRINGADSKYLFSAKRKGYRYVQQHKRMLWRGLMIAKQKNDVIRAVELLTNIPSLGMAKAGFVAQCLGFNVACLDSHNLDRLGMPRSAMRLCKRTKRAVRHKKIVAYVTLTQQHGAKYWWDTWCEYVADKGTNKRLATSDAVSAYHVQALAI
jgi:hypothetical protein|tara:strand:+ start:672 stop:1262 length:591 start_codon:yes stop_codon:yes gene_type:complete